MTQTEVRLTHYSSCAGCAAKIGAETLELVLQQLPGVADARLVVPGGDDAGVVELPDGTWLVQTLDFFTPIVDDPYQFGQVAAANALSDVYAMGGQPLSAMNIVCFPTKTLGADILARILQGGADKLAEAGCLLVGGHSIEDAEPKYGVSVTGTVARGHLLRRSGARPGQKLYLTKPLGTGILTTAHKRGLVSESHLEAAVSTMCRLNREACAVALQHHATACTDVTGFGLIGHGTYLARDSGVTLVISVDRLPVLPGVEQYLSHGCFPGGSEANLRHFGGDVHWSADLAPWWPRLIADAQTSGGLLFTTEEDVPGAVQIGHVETAQGYPMRVDP